MLTETFVLDEILALEAAGQPVLIDSLLKPADGPVHPQTRALRASVRHLSEIPSRRQAVARAHAWLLLRHPLRWVREARHTHRHGSRANFANAGLIARRAARERARHIHTHFAYSADLAVSAAKLAGVPCTIQTHAWDIFHERQARLLPERLRRADAVTSVTRYNVDHLRRRLPDVPVHYAPLGVPLGSEAGPTVSGPLLCIARAVPKKGLGVLMAAMPAVLRRIPDATLELIGSGPLRMDLEAQVDSLSLRDSVTFVDRVPHDVIGTRLEACSIFVLPCRIAEDGDRDGLPTVLIEALARGLPVVTTDVAGISELVQDGETGRLVPPDDVDALAQAVIELLSDSDRARELGRAGRRRVAERHSPAAATERLQALFDGAVRKRSSAPRR